MIDCFKSAVTIFYDLVEQEALTDREYEKLTLAEDIILRHAPQDMDAVISILAVISCQGSEGRSDGLDAKAMDAAIAFLREVNAMPGERRMVS